MFYSIVSSLLNKKYSLEIVPDSLDKKLIANLSLDQCTVQVFNAANDSELKNQIAIFFNDRKEIYEIYDSSPLYIGKLLNFSISDYNRLDKPIIRGTFSYSKPLYENYNGYDELDKLVYETINKNLKSNYQLTLQIVDSERKYTSLVDVKDSLALIPGETHSDLTIILRKKVTRSDIYPAGDPEVQTEFKIRFKSTIGNDSKIKTLIPLKLFAEDVSAKHIQLCNSIYLIT